MPGLKKTITTYILPATVGFLLTGAMIFGLSNLRRETPESKPNLEEKIENNDNIPCETNSENTGTIWHSDIYISKKRSLESMFALTLAFEGNRDKKLTKEESEKNIADNLVSIVNSNGGNGSGLLITTDGWVITAYHNIDGYEFGTLKGRIINLKNESYDLDPTIIAKSPSRDIAFIKAITGREPKPIKFKIIEDNLKKGDEIKLFGLRDHRPYNQLGRVISSHRNTQIADAETGKITSTLYNTFLTDAYGVPGFSGGVITTFNGEFAGIALYIKKDKTKDEAGRIGGVKSSGIVEMGRLMVYGLYDMGQVTDK